MEQNPFCPECGREMMLRKVVLAPHPADDKHIFRCSYCRRDHRIAGTFQQAQSSDD